MVPCTDLVHFQLDVRFELSLPHDLGWYQMTPMCIYISAFIPIEASEKDLGIPSGQLTDTIDYHDKKWGADEMRILAGALARRGTGVWLDRHIQFLFCSGCCA